MNGRGVSHPLGADDSPVVGDAFAIRSVNLECLAVPTQPIAYSRIRSQGRVPNMYLAKPIR